VDSNAGVANGPDGEGQSDALQQRKVHVNVEPLSLAAGEAVGDDLKLVPDGLHMVQALFQAEVTQVVGA